MMKSQTNHFAIQSIAAALAIAACAMTFTSALTQEREGGPDRPREEPRDAPRGEENAPRRDRSPESNTTLHLMVLPDGVMIDERKISLVSLRGELEKREVARAIISSRSDTPFQNITTVLNSLKNRGISDVKLSVEDETVSIGRDGERSRRTGPRDGEGGRRGEPRDGEGMRRSGPRDGDGARREGARETEGRRNPSPEAAGGGSRRATVDGDNRRHISQWTRIYRVYDKDDDEQVTFDEWLAMKDGDMPRDRREREKGWFDQADENEDGVLTLDEWIDWKSKQIAGRE